VSSVDSVRQLEADALPERFARGWHCLGLAATFRDGRPHAVHAFGRTLAVWADSAHDIHVVDGFCRHMGGDLTRGTVKGDEIACPFHDWRWGGDGRCKSIPYARRIPPRARTLAWPVLEQDGMLFVWNDPEGNPPPSDVTIPRIAGATSENWTSWLWYSTTIENANCREVVDNVVDMAHFFYVHLSFPTYFKNIFEGHTATQLMEGVTRADAERRPAGSLDLQPSSSSAASYHGPSFMIDELTYHYPAGDLRAVLINCHYPIDTNSFVLQYGIMVERAPGTDEASADAVAKRMGDFIKLGFEQDVEIWRNKARVDNPLLCEEDGPLYQLRRWYRQFYVDVADIDPAMTARFEFELDTTSANEAWARELQLQLDQV